MVTNVTVFLLSYRFVHSYGDKHDSVSPPPMLLWSRFGHGYGANLDSVSPSLIRTCTELWWQVWMCFYFHMGLHTACYGDRFDKILSFHTTMSTPIVTDVTVFSSSHIGIHTAMVTDVTVFLLLSRRHTHSYGDRRDGASCSHQRDNRFLTCTILTTYHIQHIIHIPLACTLLFIPNSLQVLVTAWSTPGDPLYSFVLKNNPHKSCLTDYTGHSWA